LRGVLGALATSGRIGSNSTQVLTINSLDINIISEYIIDIGYFLIARNNYYNINNYNENVDFYNNYINVTSHYYLIILSITK